MSDSTACWSVSTRTSQGNKNESSFIEFVDFSGVTIPIIVDFKPQISSCKPVEAGSSTPLVEREITSSFLKKIIYVYFS